ncbi:hypothetical protein HYPSUDRAFT_196866 [Hypholoma sublateritium FD-334 SS-4]|uniref:Uncharacterized protein n=1 Tax=Hypholoma sublateritium (strain FD-334 SS-4) TaxID=945553 RepID=A0A0D2MXB7_HYPSF|nr:hypothetical protein HYPSUDRAFT_196866 [Hypholoma sublateritium FD-334 SS-4]
MAPVSIGLQNFEYRDPSTHTTATFMIFGEILHDSKLGAIGNHFTGRVGESVTPIRDGGKTHDTLKLGIPSNPTEELQILYDNQFVPLNHVYLDDCDFDKDRGVIAMSHECSEAVPAPENLGDTLNRFRVGLEKKFGPVKAEKRAVAVPVNQRFMQKRPLAHVSSPSQRESFVPQAPPSVAPVGIGGFYEPSLMPDYQSRYFALVHDKLIQHDVRDIDGNLIPAYDNLDSLAPGTVVAIMSSLYTFNIPMGPSSYKRIYCLRAHSVQVLLEADDESRAANAVSGDMPPIPAPAVAIDTNNDFQSLATKRKAATHASNEKRVQDDTPQSPRSLSTTLLPSTSMTSARNNIAENDVEKSIVLSPPEDDSDIFTAMQMDISETIHSPSPVTREQEHTVAARGGRSSTTARNKRKAG